MYEEETEYSPFYGIEKGAVLQEARVFHDPHLNPRRCQQVITKLLYLLCQGETFTKKEATEVFFAVTKLFQNQDANLRRMVYLVIKEICPSAEEIMIVTNSLMKDMNSNNDLYHANAIRVLYNIIDSSLLQQIERFFKQSVVSRDAVVATAALVAGLRLAPNNMEIIKRWSNEIQEAVQSRNAMVQFHAIALMHQLKQNDRLAISKLVTSLTRGPVKSPLAQCLLVRYVATVIADSQPQANANRPFYDFLEMCMRHKSEIVIFEAAKAITELNDVSQRELSPAVTVLQLFLTSGKPILRFAAVRILAKVAMKHPGAVASCNVDLEGLISDQNRSISTLAITTLLKIGNEGSIDRLMKQISSFMTEIADDFKIVVVEAITALCLKYPAKYRTMMSFLSNILREEGGFEYKRTIVESILKIVQAIPDAKEVGLSHLCEFIEDCEFTYLSTQILHLLGKEGPTTTDPSKYIRYIYNRIILENATVRASAVSALAKFGASVADLTPRVIMLLKRTLFDNDDEVRDRATMHLKLLGGAVELPHNGALPFGLKNMEAALNEYLAGPTTRPFDASTVPEDEEPEEPAATSKPAAPPPPTAAAYAEELNAIPELAELGELFKSVGPIDLVESETEYSITGVKHIFPDHVVFQFNCQNTIPEQVLENVSVLMDLAEAEDFEEHSTIPLPVMPLREPGTLYVVLSRGHPLATGVFVNILQFVAKEVDPATGEAEEEGYEDEYQLEDLALEMPDYIKSVSVPNFRKKWEEMDPESERADEYGLGQRDSLQDAVEAIIGTLGLQACEGTEAVPPNARSHMCLLSGEVIGDCSVLARVKLGIDRSFNVAMKLEVRSDDPDVSDALHEVIG